VHSCAACSLDAALASSPLRSCGEACTVLPCATRHSCCSQQHPTSHSMHPLYAIGKHLSSAGRCTDLRFGILSSASARRPRNASSSGSDTGSVTAGRAETVLQMHGPHNPTYSSHSQVQAKGAVQPLPGNVSEAYECLSKLAYLALVC
jgi:hypothetical protein